MTAPIETPHVIFVDVLGFARLVLKEEGALGLLDPFYNSSHTFDELRRDFYEARERTPQIERTFALFHVGLEEEIALALKGSHLHAIVFSDSAFVAFEHGIDALVFCQRLMRKMITGGVPVRMGVAYGSFKPLRFKTDLARDITLHSSYFLGSGVVKAHAAESCGVSGLRILLHRDFAMPPGFEEDELLTMSPPANDAPLRKTAFEAALRVADRELAYLNRHIPERALPDDHCVNENIDAENTKLISEVQTLRQSATEEFHYHYDDTLLAMSKMPTGSWRQHRP